jgi:hypothetical protein
MSNATIKVKKYKGNRQAEVMIERMMSRGWHVQSHTTRKAMYSLATGIFTRKQIHTVTFEKPANPSA